MNLVRKVLALFSVVLVAAAALSVSAQERTGEDGFVWATAFEGRISPLGLACLTAFQKYVIVHARECGAEHTFDAHRAACAACRQTPAMFKDWVGEAGALCATGTALLAAADGFAPEAAALAGAYDAARREWELELSSVRRRCDDLKNEALNCESAYQKDPVAQRKADELRASKSIDAAAYGRILAQHAEALRRLPFHPDERVGEGAEAPTRYAAGMEALDRQVRGGELTAGAAVPQFIRNETVLIRARELDAARDAAFADLYFQLIALCDEVDSPKGVSSESSNQGE